MAGERRLQDEKSMYGIYKCRAAVAGFSYWLFPCGATDTGERKVGFYSDADGWTDLWYDTMYPSFADDRVLLYTAGSFGGDDRYCIQSFQHGQPCSAAGCSDRGAFKEDGQGDTRCGKMVPSGFLFSANGYAISSGI